MNITSKIEICSAASLILGGPSISDINDGTRESEVLSNLIDLVFENLIYNGSWSFATKDIPLSISTEEPDDTRYKYKVILPLDYCKLISLYYNNSVANINDFSVSGDGTTLYCNATDLRLKYIYIPDVYRFSPAFKMAFIYALAYNACEAITGIATKSNELAQMMNKYITEAKIRDAQADSINYHLSYPRSLGGRR